MNEMKPIGTALLSYGMSGEVFHGPLLKAHPYFNVKAVFHRPSSKRTHHGWPIVNSIDAVLTNPEIELVIVNTPPDSHFTYAAAGLESGKHVIVEKPFTVTSKQARELINMAKQNERVLTVFHNRRWDGGFLTLQKVLGENMLGRIVEFELHYDRFRSHIEPGTWKEVDADGTGILYNLGSHMLDQVIVLFGMPDYLDARMGIQRTGGKVLDYYDLRLDYGGMNVIVKSSYLVREQGPMYKLHGTEGSYVKYGIDPQEEALKEKKLTPGSPQWGVEPREWWGKLNTNIKGVHFEGQLETLRGNYLAYYDNICQAIRNNQELAVKPEQAQKVIELIEASIESNRLKKALKIEK